MALSSPGYAQLKADSSRLNLELSSKYPKWVSEQSIREAIHYSNPLNAPYAYGAPQPLNEHNHMAQGWTVTVDTRDQETCRKVYNQVRNFHNINGSQSNAQEACRYDKQNPAVTFFIFQDESGNQEYVTQLSNKLINSTEQNITNDTRNLALVMVATMGVLWMMPESATGWNREEIRKGNGIFGLYSENIKAGPVMDKDDAKFNLIGHPISGAAYYVMARHSGLSAMQAFGYSVAMSTFFWEYGFEAVAEIPSIQDLIITPVIGSLLGHLLYNLEERIDAQEGLIWGSKSMGNFVKVLINPMGALSQKINSMLSHRAIKDSHSEIYLRGSSTNSIGQHTGNSIGFRTVFVF